MLATLEDQKGILEDFVVGVSQSPTSPDNVSLIPYTVNL